MPHHCHDEHCDHDHSSDITPAIQNLLYTQLDFPSIRTLNESTSGSGASICKKPWSERLSDNPILTSDADEQIILHIPFTGQVRLHSIHIRSDNTSSAPKTVKAYINQDDLDFTSIETAKVTQEFELACSNEVQDLGVKRALWNATRSITLFFSENWSGGEEDETRIGYVGFKGDFMKLNREPVDVLYEAAARPSDHKVEGVGGEVGGMGFGAGGGRQGF